MGLVRPEENGIPIPIVENKTIVIPTGSWIKNGEYYEYKILSSKITADSVVNVAFDLASLEYVRAANIQPVSVSGQSECTIYAVTVPTANLTCTYSVIREGEE